MKKILSIVSAGLVALSTLVTPALSATFSGNVSVEGTVVKVTAVTKTTYKYEEQKVISHYQEIRKPIVEEYYEVVPSGNAGEVVMGAIIGGIIGKAITNNDGGAAVGAIAGGAIANENSSGGTQTVKKTRVVGYETVSEPVYKTKYVQVPVTTVVHHNVTVDVNGSIYKFKVKPDVDGMAKHNEGDKITLKFKLVGLE